MKKIIPLCICSTFGFAKQIASVRLTEKVKSSGCAAKFPASKLKEVLSSVPQFKCDRLLAGFDGAEDAAVYKISDTQCMIQTVDFFPPMVDNPYDFGQIAAANALSDIYAMGGRPAMALSLLCFPSCMDTALMAEILKGGADKCAEAGIPVAGGHTIADEVPKYGLCVTGFADNGRVWRNNTVREGDVLVLTKKLGIGIINTAVKAGEADESIEREVISQMKRLNACPAAIGLDISACTDVTGFGLLGHLFEMMGSGEHTAVIHTSRLPLFKEALEFAKLGLIPEGMYNNIDYVADNVSFDSSVSQELRDLLYDPQTSGGLLFSLPATEAQKLVASYPEAVIIGSIGKRREKMIEVTENE